MIQGYDSVDDIVRSCIADEGRNTLHKYIWYLHYALDFVREYQQDFTSEVITVRKDLDQNRGFYFPDDYVDWRAVGVKVGDRIMAFTYDNTVTAEVENNEPNKVFFNEYENQKPNLYYPFYNIQPQTHDEGVLRAYYYGATWPGYFKVDDTKRRIQFSADVMAEYVYLEYISTGIRCNEKTLLKADAHQLCKTYIKMRYAIHKYGIESAKARTWQAEYVSEVDKVLVRNSNLNYNNIIRIVNRHFTQTPRN